MQFGSFGVKFCSVKENIRAVERSSQSVGSGLIIKVSESVLNKCHVKDEPEDDVRQ